MLVSRAILLCLAAVLVGWADSPSAAELAREGAKAEKAGDVVRAYLYYSEAAAVAPGQSKYWLHALTLRTQAALKGKPVPLPYDLTGTPAEQAAKEIEPPPPGFSTIITDQELAEVKRMKPPPRLQPTPGERTLDLKGTARGLFSQATQAFGLGAAFDSEFEPAGAQRHIRMENVDYRDALHTLEAATGAFVFPMGKRLVMVAKDTAQKRTELEPTLAITVPVPQTVTPQEAQEVGRAVQQAMDIQKLAVDTQRRMVLIKDRISKVRPAEALFLQLAHTRAQVSVELEFLELDRSSTLSYGFLMPSQFPMFWLGGGATPSSIVSLARFVAGHSIVGVGIANSQLFATMSQSTSKTLLKTEVRALDGQSASFHVGDKYPIITAGFFGGSVPGVAPSFNLEDLGVIVKFTPHVHGTTEVSLDIEAELKVLSGEALNGVPLISTRKLQSKVRLKNGESAVVAGLLSDSDARTITGIPVMVRLPFLRKNDHNRSSTDVVLLLKPHLLSEPPDPWMTRELWVGSEGRLEIPL